MKHALAVITLAALSTSFGACGGEHATASPTEGADLGTTEQADHSYTIYNTDGLGVAKVRSCPGTNGAVVALAPEGLEVHVVCQTVGQHVSDGTHSSSVWDKIAERQYISDLYLRTPSIGFLTPGIPLCDQVDTCPTQ